MTNFATWWVDHWPLLVAIVLYPFYHYWVGGALVALSAKIKRRREQREDDKRLVNES